MGKRLCMKTSFHFQLTVLPLVEGFPQLPQFPVCTDHFLMFFACGLVQQKDHPPD